VLAPPLPGIPGFPLSVGVVISTAGGVTGSAGRLQSFGLAAGTLTSPKISLIARNSGNAPEQQPFVKSSKSIVHAATPPNPEFLTYLAFKITDFGSS
jgi:hypothetical protein